MSKQVRWQIPFVSRLGTAYRVDIYDEQDGSWSGVTQLLGGTSPFTTDEDDSDDYFEPIRPQTGTIEVCTLMPDGNYITLDDILPANNIARPVRLVSISGSTETIEWQGFLSCEAYDQDYTSIPQIIQLPVISVLEAMASVEVDQTKLSGLNNVGTTIQKLLEIFIDKAGISYFSQYYIPTAARGRNILSKYIDATVLFEQKEYNNENSTTYIVSGMSIKDCLARIATYMGWCCREVSGSLYFFAAGETSGYSRHYRQGVIDPSTGTVTIIWMVDFNETAVVSRDIVALLWAGVDHKRTVQQGAKSVEVVAKLEKYAVNLDLPPFPYGETYEIHRQYNGPTNWIYILASLVNNPYNNVTLNYYKATISYVYGSQSAAETTTLADLLAHLWDAEGIVDIYSGHGTETVRSGAFFVKVAYENQDQSAHSTNDGLFVSWLPRVINTDYSTQPIFAMRSLISYKIGGGYLKLSASLANLVVNFDNSFEVVLITKETDYTDSILMHIRFGNKYWNGSQWVDSLTKVWVDIEGSNFKKNWTPTTPVEETDGYLIPLSNNSGELEIAIYPQNNMPNASRNTFLLNTFFSNLGVEYVQTDDDTLSDRSENHYFRLLGTNFRDEISIGTELASTLNNQPSPSLIMNSETEAMTELNYGTTQAPDMRRPEVDLLNRLATYYGAARQRLDLIVEHPTAAPLPLLRLNGISPDSRTYAPLAESRDWQQDSSTIKCFETPTE